MQEYKLIKLDLLLIYTKNISSHIKLSKLNHAHALANFITEALSLSLPSIISKLITTQNNISKLK